MAKHEDAQRIFKRRIVNKQDLYMILLIIINLGTFLAVGHPYYMTLLVKYGIIK